MYMFGKKIVENKMQGEKKKIGKNFLVPTFEIIKMKFKIQNPLTCDVTKLRTFGLRVGKLASFGLRG